MTTLPGEIVRLEERFAEWTGIDLDRGRQRTSLERFVEARMLSLGLSSVEAYVGLLEGSSRSERERLINASTVGLTWFFRDPEQLRAIAGVLRDGVPAARPVQVWVAGCATGEDAWSLAMLGESAGRELQVLATDINSDFLTQAEAGRYGEWSLRDLPPALAAEHLLPADDGRKEIGRAVRRRVRFLRHNLMDAPPVPEGAAAWDLILCRNVFIYFHPARACATAERMAGALAPGGWLFLGASDVVESSSDELKVTVAGGRYALRRAVGPLRLVEQQPQEPAVPAVRLASHPVEARVSDAGEVLARANGHHVAGRLPEALQLYSQVLALNPLCTEARLFLGLVQYKAGNYQAAAQSLRATLFLAPAVWPASLYLALSYEKLGHLFEAYCEYRRVGETAGRAPPLEYDARLLGELEAWKSEIVAMAAERARRNPHCADPPEKEEASTWNRIVARSLSSTTVKSSGR